MSGIDRCFFLSLYDAFIFLSKTQHVFVEDTILLQIRMQVCNNIGTLKKKKHVASLTKIYPSKCLNLKFKTKTTLVWTESGRFMCQNGKHLHTALKPESFDANIYDSMWKEKFCKYANDQCIEREIILGSDALKRNREIENRETKKERKKEWRTCVSTYHLVHFGWTLKKELCEESKCRTFFR